MDCLPEAFQPPQEVGINIPIFQRKKLRLRQVRSVPNRAGVCTQLLWLSKSAALAHVHCHVSDQQWGVEQGGCIGMLFIWWSVIGGSEKNGWEGSPGDGIARAKARCVPGLACIFPTQFLGLAFWKNPGFFWWRVVFRNQDWDAWCANCHEFLCF